MTLGGAALTSVEKKLKATGHVSANELYFPAIPHVL
jgi:hypothetical protein